MYCARFLNVLSALQIGVGRPPVSGRCKASQMEPAVGGLILRAQNALDGPSQTR